MSKLHSMPIFWADFFADTEHMSPDGAKAYLFLLGHAWLRGAALQNDDTVLARLARVSGKKWYHIKDEILAFWILGEDGFWRQKRLTKEYDFIIQKVEDNRKNGSLGGQAKAANKLNENKKTTVAKANQTPKQPTLTPIRKKDARANGKEEKEAPVPSSKPLPSIPKVNSAGGVYVRYGTPAGDAWERRYRTKYNKPAPRDFRGGWYFPSEYPA